MRPDPEALRSRLHTLGFDVVRFAPIGEFTPGSKAFADWLELGYQGEMAWLERSLPKRSDPDLVLKGAQSMIVLGVNYGDTPARSGRPTWARYSLYRDYHDTIKPGLVAAGRELEQWGGLSDRDYRYYVDTGPVLERSWSAQAGVGFTGKNAMLISRDFGNWLFLAAILVRTDLPANAAVSRRYQDQPVGTLCGGCTACLEACPTGALPAPGVLDARRCISYLTIELKGVIPVEWRQAIGDRIYGCDVCAEVCPWNRFAQVSRSVLLAPRPEIAELTLRDILELTPERFAEVFKGTAIKRLKLRGLLRNACIVAANIDAQDCIPAIHRLAGNHSEAMVRAHAVWALRVFGLETAELVHLAEQEEDEVVLAEYRREELNPGTPPRSTS